MPLSQPEQNLYDLVSLHDVPEDGHARALDMVTDSLERAFLPTEPEPAFTVVGILNGQPFVQSFRCRTATDAALAALLSRFLPDSPQAGSFCGLSIDRGDLIAVFPGVQIPDDSWRKRAKPETAVTYDGKVYEVKTVE